MELPFHWISLLHTLTHSHARTHTHTTHTTHAHTTHTLVSPSPPQLKEKKDKLNVSAARKKEAFVAGRTHGVGDTPLNKYCNTDPHPSAAIYKEFCCLREHTETP